LEGAALLVTAGGGGALYRWVQCTLGDGQRIKFWQDRWIDGESFEQLAPTLFKLLKPGRRDDTVAMALHNNCWATAFRGTPSVAAFVEYLQVWERLQQVMAQPGRQDVFAWRGTATGVYTAK
jgi:hypothetical protein